MATMRNSDSYLLNLMRISAWEDQGLYSAEKHFVEVISRYMKNSNKEKIFWD